MAELSNKPWYRIKCSFVENHTNIIGLHPLGDKNYILKLLVCGS